MEDHEIVDLYWQRDESAIEETTKKYNHYLIKIAYNVLFDLEDSMESVNDTYYKAWNAMPPHRPEFLSTFLGKITRQGSIDMLRKKNSIKRGKSQYILSLAELEDIVASGNSPEDNIVLNELANSISNYLREQKEDACNIFICRYYFMDSIKDIASYFGTSQSSIKSKLFRLRNGLKEYLNKEGYEL